MATSRQQQPFPAFSFPPGSGLHGGIGGEGPFFNTAPRMPLSSNQGGGAGKKTTSQPSPKLRDLISLLMLNSATIALACGTYGSFCGNGAGVAATVGGSSASGDGAVVDAAREAICSFWLPPVPTDRYPRFSAWMFYSEISGEVLPVSNITIANQSIGVEAGSMGDDSTASTLSPVLISWITLVLLYLVNCVADVSAAHALQVGKSGIGRDVKGGCKNAHPVPILSFYTFLNQYFRPRLIALPRSGPQLPPTPNLEGSPGTRGEVAGHPTAGGAGPRSSWGAEREEAREEEGGLPRGPSLP